MEEKKPKPATTDSLPNSEAQTETQGRPATESDLSWANYNPDGIATAIGRAFLTQRPWKDSPQTQPQAQAQPQPKPQTQPQPEPQPQPRHPVVPPGLLVLPRSIVCFLSPEDAIRHTVESVPAGLGFDGWELLLSPGAEHLARLVEADHWNPPIPSGLEPAPDPTPEDIAQLLAFLPRLTDRIRVEDPDSFWENSQLVYSDVFREFLEAISKPCWTHHRCLSKNPRRCFQQPAWIGVLDLEGIQATLTFGRHIERYWKDLSCGWASFWNAAHGAGNLQRILHRLEELATPATTPSPEDIEEFLAFRPRLLGGSDAREHGDASPDVDATAIREFLLLLSKPCWIRHDLSRKKPPRVAAPRDPDEALAWIDDLDIEGIQDLVTHKREVGRVFDDLPDTDPLEVRWERSWILFGDLERIFRRLEVLHAAARAGAPPEPRR